MSHLRIEPGKEESAQTVRKKKIHSFNSLLMKRCFKVVINGGVFYSPWLPEETPRARNEKVANKEKSNKAGAEREQRQR